MGELLQADDGTVPGVAPIPEIDLNEEYKLWSRFVQPKQAKIDAERAERLAMKREEQIAKIQQRDPTGVYVKPSKLRAGYRLPRPSISAKELEKKIDRDPTIKRIRFLLSVPQSERLARARAVIKEKEIIPLLKKIEELQHQINLVSLQLEPLLREQAKLCSQVRKSRANVRNVKVPSDYDLKKDLDAKMTAIAEGMEAQLTSAQLMKLRKHFGFWSHIKKKFRDPIPPIKKERKLKPNDNHAGSSPDIKSPQGSSPGS